MALTAQEYYPNSIDKLEREKALFPGPDPILLAGTESDDLTYLLFGSDRSNSQVEFGANQVILVRTMAAKEQLPVSACSTILPTGWQGYACGLMCCPAWPARPTQRVNYTPKDTDQGTDNCVCLCVCMFVSVSTE